MGKDYYGRLSVAFEFGLSRYLANLPSTNFSVVEAMKLHRKQEVCQFKIHSTESAIIPTFLPMHWYNFQVLYFDNCYVWTILLHFDTFLHLDNLLPLDNPSLFPGPLISLAC